MTKIRFTNIGPHKHSWISEEEWDIELIIKAIKRRRFCPECGESYAGQVVCEPCNAELVSVWPYNTPPDIWWAESKGKVWLGGQQAAGTFEAVSEVV